jgi:outer membrane protein OmpA-like peptidoglycan-associated protein
MPSADIAQKQKWNSTMGKTFVSTLIAVGLLSQGVYAQDVENTRAKPTDWEEINFVSNQAVIVDGFPSLLRLAEMLKAHPDFKVDIVGHADQIGSNRANDRLSLQRANAVGLFLQKYGATANQITVKGEGKRNLEENARNANARFINRRVVVTVTAPDGTAIGDGSIGSAIVDFIAYARAQLGKLDNISTAVQQLQTQVGGLNTSDIKQDTGQIRQDTSQIRQDTGQIRQDTSSIKQDTSTLVQRPAPLTAAETTQIAHDAGQQAADYALTQSAIRNQKYSLVGFDVGPTFGPGRIGNYAADVFGKALVPFGNGKTAEQPGTHAFVLDGDWVYDHRHPRPLRREPEPVGLNDVVLDAGLLNRFGHVQIGTLAQFEYVSLNLIETRPGATSISSRGGTFLGGGVATLNYVFNGGTIGVFGAKGFKDSSNITVTNLVGGTPSLIRYDDQVGISFAGTTRYFQAESSVAFVKRHSLDRDQQPSAMLKLSFGPSDTLQFFVEGDVNPTINAFNYGYRVVAGFQFGNWLKARNFGATQGVVPVILPRPHYELLPR